MKTKQEVYDIVKKPSGTNAHRKQKRQTRRFDKLEKRKDFQEIMDEVDDYAQHQW